MISITKAIPDDVLDIQLILYKTWLETYPNKEIGITEEDVHERFKDRLTPEAIEARKQKLLSNPSRNEFFLVAKEDGKMVGVCGIGVHDEHNQLQAIYVLPEHQRKGIGKMLWDEALKHFDSEKKTIVQVATYNEKAINFYKKLGFVDTGKRFEDGIHTMPISGVPIPEMEMEMPKRNEA